MGWWGWGWGWLGVCEKVGECLGRMERLLVDAAAVEGEISLGRRGEMVMVMVMVMDGEERTVRMGGLWWLAEAVTVEGTGAERGMARGGEIVEGRRWGG